MGAKGPGFDGLDDQLIGAGVYAKICSYQKD